MIDKRFFADESKKLSLLEPKPCSVFWFDIDIVELSLFHRHYGRNSGDKFVCELEEFICGIPEVGICSHSETGHFIFDVVMNAPCDEHDIIKFWKTNITSFTNEKQQYYPEFCIRISCGICPMKTSDYSCDAICEAIENAVLARKESRTNKTFIPVVFSDDLLDELRLLHIKEVNVTKALNEDRFTFYLQPIVDLKTGKIIAAEALAREITESGEIICPDSFLPIMESNGTIIELDYLILGKVCKNIRERLDSGKPVTRISINLSRLHLDDNTTIDTLISITDEYNISPELLNFELTETLPLDEFSKAKDFINNLRDKGFSVSIDDYGAGYTGITIWQDLDFDVLKMDRRFMSDDETMKMKNTVLIPSTLDLAKKMNIHVVCEGVERLDQCKKLQNWGCDTAQGFYFSRPIPADEFYKNYEESNGTFPITLGQ